MGAQLAGFGASAPITSLSVLVTGAKGDDTNDDRAAIMTAWGQATANKLALYFPPGRYKCSKYLDFPDGVGTQIFGDNATIHYASDDATVVHDGVATSDAMARSGILFRYCRDVKMRGVTIEGADTPAIDTTNLGNAIYATHCVGMRVTEYVARFGHAMYVQDSLKATNSTGDSIGVAAGVVTLNDASALFRAGHVTGRVTITGAANQVNNGVFPITGYTSPTQITYTNPAAIAEVTAGLGWAIDDNDRDTRITNSRSDRCRGSSYVCTDGLYQNVTFEHPTVTRDRCGHAAAYTVAAGGSVTIYDSSAPFDQSVVGKYIKTTGSTTGAHDGTFLITAFVSSTKISYANANGGGTALPELIPSAASWWICGGEKTGIGAGGAALAKAGNVMTLTALVASFAASDVGAIIRVRNATTAGNNGSFVITGYTSPTQITYTNAGGAAEAYSGMWGLDSRDNNGPAGSAYGTTHAIYLFAGRSNAKVLGCTFRGIRTSCVKISGSSSAIRQIEVANCTAEECGNFVIIGADDSQEHSGVSIHHNVLTDVGTGRDGWNEGNIIGVLGSRGVSICDNTFIFTRDAIHSVDGVGVGTACGINGSRYVVGVSQPLEDLTVARNKFVASPAATHAASIMRDAINVGRCGMLARYASNVTFAINGTTVTMTDPNAEFSQDLVGQTVRVSFATDAGNNGSFVVTQVGNAIGTNQTTLQYTNGAGVTNAVASGSYAIFPTRGGGGLVCFENEMLYCSTNGVVSANNVAPQVFRNTCAGLQANFKFTADLALVCEDNRELGAGTQSARIVIDDACAWPTIGRNTVTNNGIGPSSARDMGIGLNNNTSVDLPLAGRSGRVRPSQAQEEVTFAYGSNLVDGDTFLLNATTCTYKTTAPGANQFNSSAGLIALINAVAGFTSADYGAGFTAGDVLQKHIRIRKTAQTVADGTFNVSVSTVNPTALVILRNDAGANTKCKSRGAGSAGPTADKTVVWSNCCTFAGPITLIADNASARTLLAGGFNHLKNANDGGCNDEMQHAASAGTEEMRFVIH